MRKPLQYLAQAALYALFFIPIAYFTQAPVYRHLPEDTAVLKVAIRHAGKIVGECTALTGSEYDQLPANMKRLEICPRERSPLRLELPLDGNTLYSEKIPASGLHNDGVSSMYQRFTVPAGTHQLTLLMNDDVAVPENTWTLEQSVELAPAQVLVATFKEGFRLQ